MDSEEEGGAPKRVVLLASDLRRVVGALRRRLQERAGPDRLTPAQIAVLGRLEREGPSGVTALAQGAGMRSQSMGSNLATLEAAGLIARAPDPKDGRRSLLSLTASCRERIRSGRLTREDWLTGAVRATLTKAEQKELARALRLLRRVVDS